MKTRALLAAAVLVAGLSPLARSGGWLAQSTPSTRHLYGVSYSSSLTWTAVGDAGTILRSTDGGSTWSSVFSPAGDALRGVSFRDSIGVAVGIAGLVLRSTDAGGSWSKETRPTTRSLYAVSMGDSVAVATGEEGTILVSTDAGVTWASRGAGTASILFGVSVKGGVAVGVGGGGAVVMSGGKAQSWGLTVLGQPQAIFFYATSFVTGSTGWAVGASLATGSIIVKSTDFGFVWSTQSAPTTNTLTGVSFARPDTGTAVGFNGTIIHTTNGGADWLLQQSPSALSLNAVSFIDGFTGIAVGDSGIILRTSDGGLTAVDANSAPAAPPAYGLLQNYPNPFNPSTTIRYTIGSSLHVRLTVCDILGREVATLVNDVREAGEHEVRFDATGMASGVYWYTIRAGSQIQARKMLLMR